MCVPYINKVGYYLITTNFITNLVPQNVPSDSGCLPFTQKMQKFSVGRQVERLIWSSQTENFQRKQDFLNGSPKFPNGISKGKSVFCSLLASSSRPVPVEMSMEMAHTHPMEISTEHFEASHLLQVSTTHFFLIKW